MSNRTAKMFLGGMIILIKTSQKLRRNPYIISNMSPSRNISFLILLRNINLHPFHTPNTSHTKRPQRSQQVFLINWNAEFMSIVFCGTEKTQTNVAVQHSDPDY